MPTVRTAVPADVAAIVDLVQSAYRGDSSRVGWTTEADLLDGQRTDAESVTATISSTASRVLLAEDDAGELVGCCQLDRRDDGVGYFGLFAVRPLRQGAGIGDRLLDVAERMAMEELGARTMELTVIAQRTELIGWYERRGYRVTGDTRPFPYGDERFGQPRRDDLRFAVLTKALAADGRQPTTAW